MHCMTLHLLCIEWLVVVSYSVVSRFFTSANIGLVAIGSYEYRFNFFPFFVKLLVFIRQGIGCFLSARGLSVYIAKPSLAACLFVSLSFIYLRFFVVCLVNGNRGLWRETLVPHSA